MPKRFNLIIFFFLVTLFGCKKNNQHPGVIKVSDQIPASFIDFYTKFHQDSSYQFAHINFPLQGSYTKMVDNQMTKVDTSWQFQSWKMHRPFNDHNGTYTKQLINFKNIIIETISDNSGKYTMERRFSQLGNQWYLIYYSAI